MAAAGIPAVACDRVRPALLTGDENPSHVAYVLVVFVAVPMMLLAGLGAVISLFVRFRRARVEERQQIKWFASAAALTLVWFVFELIVVELLSAEGGLPEVTVPLSSLLVLPSIPIATGIAILRYRLYDIDVIINRTLVYGSLTAMLAAVYLGSVVLLQYIFRSGCLHPRNRRTIQPPEATHPVFHRPPLLQNEVRREEDLRSLLCQVA
jgi:hypothetical protein